MNQKAESALILFSIEQKSETKMDQLSTGAVGVGLPEADAQALQARFEKARGYWDAASAALLALDLDFFEVAVRFSEASTAQQVLSPKLCALLRLAFNVSITHHDAAAVAQDVNNALQQGASQEEILEVSHLSSVLGIHSCNVGFPILVEELESLGRESELAAKPGSDAREAALKEAFVAARGYWSPSWDQPLRSVPDFFEAYTAYSSHSWKHGVLEPKHKEFVYIAIDVATHHLYEMGTRIHIRNALGYGATAAEIIAVFQLMSVEGLRSSTLAAGALKARLADAAAS
ncbi:carboxymuconolactone decarboxylase family protein [Variovorax sp. RHLX14]|uniref:carboxymuconolactone decarboxylase family protein n=1 Tax=Variovorax sp. RHLX14 TaxID=1259731 RepID=UPI003F44CFCD